MELRFTFESFFSGANTRHFLLETAVLQVELAFHDNSRLTVAGVSMAGGFRVSIQATDIPDLAAPMPGSGFLKKQVTQLSCSFSVPRTVNGKQYELLRIVQRLAATPGKGHSDANPVYTLAPAGWLNGAGALQVGNAATHPLVKLDRLAANEVRLNALVVNLTELWNDLHVGNVHYDILRLQLGDSWKVSFQVFANLSGNAFIWYACVPLHLAASKQVSPHVFFAPSDNSELQNEQDEKKYLLSNATHFRNDGRALYKYVWPPLVDVAIKGLPTTHPLDEWKEWRNVVGFKYLTAAHTSITTLQWQLPRGLEKALYGDGGVKPKQFLLIPQNVGHGAQSTKGIQVLGPADALSRITQTIALVLQTNTTLLAKDSQDKVDVDKLVLSAYSESGFDLWIGINNNKTNLKAVIAIEPQNLNKDDLKYGPGTVLGKDVLPPLIKLGQCRIFMVGRHHLPKYKPDIPDSSTITFMPPDPRKFFQYPPDPAQNPFIRYRVERMTNAALDPHMTQDEKQVLNDLASAAPPVTGMNALKKIFHVWGDLDCTCAHEGCACTERLRHSWYSHQYAMSGGQIMQLPASGPIYDQPITYRTFFQEAVEAVG